MTTLILSREELDQESLQLEAERFHHLFRVRRLRVGDGLRVTDGLGRARRAQVQSVDRRSARVLLGAPAPSNEPGRGIDLIVAVPRPQRAGWLVEKATELGVRAVRFVRSERSPRDYGKATMGRLARLAAAAVEQCERSRVPEISGVHQWDEVEGFLAATSERWLLDPEGPPLERSAARRAAPLAIAVGPEGGWTGAESVALMDLGCAPVGLGPRVLRVETAALVALALGVTPSVDTSRSRSVG